MVIRIENIKKDFGKHHVLKGVDLDFVEGNIYTILGPNGSGKTTLMKSILGLVKPTDGVLLVNGRNAINDYQHRNSIGYAPQIARFPENLTVKEVIDLVKRVRKQPANPDRFIKLFEIEDFYKQRLKNLSGGTRQKVNLVLALMFNPEILILDEPTSGLDPINRIRLKELLLEMKADGKTILVTTHILHLAEEISDEIVFLLEGKIKYQGSPNKLMKLTNTPNLEKAIANTLSGTSQTVASETPVVQLHKNQNNG